MNTPVVPIDQPLIGLGRTALARHVIGIAARGSGALLITATDRIEIGPDGQLVSTEPHGIPDVHDVYFDCGKPFMHTFKHFTGAVSGVKIARADTDEPAMLVPLHEEVSFFEITETPAGAPGDMKGQMRIRLVDIRKTEATDVSIESLSGPEHYLTGPMSALMSGFALRGASFFESYGIRLCLASSTSIIIIDTDNGISVTHTTPLPFVSCTRMKTDRRHRPPVLCIAATGEIYGFSPDAFTVAFVPIMRLDGDFSHAKFLDSQGTSDRSALLLVQRPDEKAILYDIDILGRTATRMQADDHARWDAAVRGRDGRLFVCAHTVGGVAHDLYVAAYQTSRVVGEMYSFNPDDELCLSMYSDGLLMRDGESIGKITAYTRVVRGHTGRATRSTRGSTSLTTQSPDMTIDFGVVKYAEEWYRWISGFIEEQQKKQ